MKLKTKQKRQLLEISIFIVIIVIGLIFGVITKDDILAAFTAENSNTTTNTTTDKEDISNKTFKVLKVVDGDTIQIDYNGKKEKVRMIGIDTPESVHPDETRNNENGKIASEYTKKLLTDKEVTLELDVQERDKYGRILAYVYLNGKMINKKLLEDGYAQVATFPPNVKYVKEFTKIQEKAKEAEKGLWAEEYRK